MTNSSDGSSAVQSSEHFSIVSTTPIASGNFVTLSDRVIKNTDGEEFSRDYVAHPGAVAVVPMTEDHKVHMVRQYRSSLDGNLWEIPAGKLDIPGEDLQVAAARELAEEAGLIAGTYVSLCGIHNAVGFSDEYIHIYLGTDLTTTEVDLEGPEEQVMEQGLFSLDVALSMIGRGEITDAKTVAGLFAAARNLG